MFRNTTLAFISFLISILLLNSLSAQELKKTSHTNKIYEQSQVRIKGEYEGGKKQLLKILSSNLEYPIQALNSNIQGDVIVKFIIEKNGTITNFEILKDIGYECANEIIRVLKKTQSKWNSAKINKKRVRSYYILRVMFKIPSN
jgi:periplasmic protein TonB